MVTRLLSRVCQVARRLAQTLGRHLAAATTPAASPAQCDARCIHVQSKGFDCCGHNHDRCVTSPEVPGLPIIWGSRLYPGGTRH